MEWVIVRYPTKRKVFMDGNSIGDTNVVLAIEAGPHVFDLGPGGGYTPARDKRTVKDTSSDDPLEIQFHEV